MLNKLDNFKSADDSIASSIEGVRNDLLHLGFEEPVICPLSAYFALLLKMKMYGEAMTEDEQDAYDYYVKNSAGLSMTCLSTFLNPALKCRQQKTSNRH